VEESNALESPARLRERLVRLREARRGRQSGHRSRPGRRQPLSPAARQAILQKSDGRCHICGGSILSGWQADHVLAHAGGGKHSVANYLAAHALCNNFRWDYDPEEFQWVLKIGVWARLQMEKGGRVGDAMLAAFAKRQGSAQRRKSPRKPAA
jgi:5-methylcytosine-specific restriction endonuclease McrA